MGALNQNSYNGQNNGDEISALVLDSNSGRYSKISSALILVGVDRIERAGSIPEGERKIRNNKYTFIFSTTYCLGYMTPWPNMINAMRTQKCIPEETYVVAVIERVREKETWAGMDRVPFCNEFFELRLLNKAGDDLLETLVKNHVCSLERRKTAGKPQSQPMK
jgi:hypothetical protein